MLLDISAKFYFLGYIFEKSYRSDFCRGYALRHRNKGYLKRLYIALGEGGALCSNEGRS